MGFVSLWFKKFLKIKLLLFTQRRRFTMATVTSSSVKATELANRFFNDVASNSHNVALLDELLHPDFRSHHYPAPPGSNKAEFIAGIKGLLTAFPDIRVVVHDQFGQGDRVFTYFSWTATHKGNFNGIAPTGKQVKVEGMDIWREQDGKMRENWVVMDIMGLMIQLGVVPPPAAK
jgi:predicted SnoaL-like aldol condensation-catalyzing enzyme